jgi:hypothetical protein
MCSTVSCCYQVYTAALRGALVEWGGDPVASLPTRLKAADSLPELLGMTRDAHEALLLRALDANSQLVSELQVSDLFYSCVCDRVYFIVRCWLAFLHTFPGLLCCGHNAATFACMYCSGVDRGNWLHKWYH